MKETDKAITAVRALRLSCTQVNTISMQEMLHIAPPQPPDNKKRSSTSGFPFFKGELSGPLWGLGGRKGDLKRGEQDKYL